GISFYRQQPAAVLWRNGTVENSYQAMTSETRWHGLETSLATWPAGLPAVICLHPHQYDLYRLEVQAVGDVELADALRFRLRDVLPPNAEQHSVIPAFRLPAGAYRGGMDMADAAAANRPDTRQRVDWCQPLPVRQQQLLIRE